MESTTVTEPRDTPTDFSEIPQQVQHDYFGFTHTEKFYFPDGITYFEIQKMNEGQKSKFQKSTQRDLTLEKGSGNAKFSMDPARERHELIKSSVISWNLTRGGQPIPFDARGRAIQDFLDLGDPQIVEDIELFIRKLNPWLLNDLTVEEIDKQIQELQELRVTVEEKERGESS